MAEIVDRLVTRLELRGLQEAVAGINEFGEGIAKMKQLAEEAIIFEIGEHIADALLETEKLSAQMRSFTDSAKESQEAITWLKRTANEIGATITDTKDAFFALLDMGIKPSRRELEDIYHISTATGKSMKEAAQEVARALYGGDKRAFRALGLSAEEIARMGGGSKAIALEIERRYGGANDSETPTANILNQMKNSWDEFLESLGVGFGPMIRLLTSAATLLVKAASILSNALVGALGEITYGIGHLVSLLPGTFFKNFSETIIGNGKKMMAGATEGLLYALGISKGGLPEHFKGLNPEGSGGIGNIIRQMVGNSAIGKIGVSGTELPGLVGRMGQSPITVKISTDQGAPVTKALEDIVNHVLDQLNRHGVFRQQMNS